MINNLSQKKIQKSIYALGTQINLTVIGTNNDLALEKSVDLIKYFEDLFTVNRTNSEVMKVNHFAGEMPVQVSSATYYLIKKAVQYSRDNFGFNAAIGPLVKLWKIGFAGANKPNDKDIQAKMKLIDPFQIQLDDNNLAVFLKYSGMELDLGGIAKGYIADRIRDLWRSLGINSGIIDLGGNLLFVGDSLHADKKWIIGIQSPLNDRGISLGNVRLPACSAVTTGIYERFLEINGKKYHHVIDSRTGYPLKTNLASVTVFTKDSIIGEIEAKRLFFSGNTEVKLNENLYGAVFIYQDGSCKVTGVQLI
ncbi:FAD:protein FMN transferase [Companilactobacillus baiquanensis]|uniref:FAD:protein FMN transferase n=1 Tax=Companilactobacillus baiquanensis TaxID=2486005 RepID=A0ABW1UU57_9LACO|nr:FAD:protein FMN transferase [Companilactobacillus baiquanensis]